MGFSNVSRRWGPIAVAVCLLVMGGVLYAPSLRVPLLFDDLPAVRDNPSIRSLWPLSEALNPPSQLPVAGRPMVNLTFALNHALHGLDVTGYHLVNLLLHAVNGTLLFLLMHRTLRLGWPSMDEGRALALAGSAAAVWAAHPLHTETVIYITQRTELLAGFFYLLTLLACVRSWAADTRRARTAWGVLAVLACAGAMASKEIAVTLPVMVLLYERTFVSGSFGGAWRRSWRLYAGLAATWLVLLALMLPGPRSQTVGLHLGISPWESLLTQAGVIVTYLGLCFHPWPLVFFYDLPVVRSLGEAMPEAAIVAGLAGLTALAVWRWPRVGFVGAWVLLILSPTSSLVPISSELAAERRMYLPLAGVIAGVVLGAHWAMTRPRWRGVGRWAWALAVVAWMVLLAGLTLDRQRDYRSAEAIWRDTLEKQPDNAVAHFGLAEALIESGRRDLAIMHYERSLTLQPANAHARYNLAVALAAEGRLTEARDHLRRALESQPEDPQMHNNLGVVLARLGDLDGAAAHFQEALRLDPGSANAARNLEMAKREQAQQATQPSEPAR